MGVCPPENATLAGYLIGYENGQGSTGGGFEGIEMAPAFDSSELAGTMSEIVAYGTAVVVAQDANAPQPGE